MTISHSLALRFLLALALAVGLARTAPSQGQGEYLNVESPQVSPIALANVGGRRVLLLCNTPDNSVEIWSTEATPVFLYRVPVGLEPVSVHASGDRFWTANFLGDSVTAAQLLLVSTDPLVIRGRVLATTNITEDSTVLGDSIAGAGDEPMDLAFDSASNSLFVTMNSSSRLAWLDATTLAPKTSKPFFVLKEGTGSPPFALKEPRSVRVQGGRVYVVGFKGGVTPGAGRPSNYDLDVLSAAIPSPILPGSVLTFDRSIPAAQLTPPGLGSTNFAARFDNHGFLWVVGGEAANFENESQSALTSTATGFVASTLYRVINPGSAAPNVSRRETNRESSGAVSSKARALSMPTDVAPFTQSGQTRKVFVAAFSSDRIGVFTSDTLPVPPNPPTGPISSWSKAVIDYPGAPVGGNPRWGPRGMVIGQNQAGQPRLYVLNRLDNSFSVFNPVTNTHVVSLPLSRDPTPEYIRAGRPFLYSADISQEGFVSCASCHTDGRTDALSWKLGAPGEDPVEPPPTPQFIFGIADVGVLGATDNSFFRSMFLVPGVFPFTLRAVPTFNALQVGDEELEDKREMVTQSLQGLSNFEVAFDRQANPEHAELVGRLFHNSPFHWRGDKPTLDQFNEAFVTLLEGPNLGTPDDSQGLDAEDMAAFERFVHSIHYPPNPRQLRIREFSANDGLFAGAQDGLRDFHELGMPGVTGRSCIQCHSLSVGSNRRLTIFFQDQPIPGYITQANRQPMESAALRGLIQKEPLLEDDGNAPDTPATTPITGHFGLNHNGILPNAFTGDGELHISINRFTDVFFTPAAQQGAQARSMKQFVHEIDWGVAPMIGRLYTYTEPAGGGSPSAALLADIRELEEQALLANAGAVIWAMFPSQSDLVRGFYLAAESTNPGHGSPLTYVEEPGGTQTTFAAIEALLAPGDALVVLGVPLGSERRIAAPSGESQGFTQVQPTNITLLPMVPNTAYSEVPSFRDNWVPDEAPTTVIDGAAPFVFNGGAVDPPFLKTVRLFQYGLYERELAAPNPAATTYGVSELRHEAPRRFRLSGTNIQKGAKLVLGVPWADESYAGEPPSSTAGQDQIPTVTLELPLFATDDLFEGQRVWETAVELEPLWAYAMVLGGPRAHGVVPGALAVQQTIDSAICAEYLICGADDGAGGHLPLPDPDAVIEPTQSLDPGFEGPWDDGPFDPDAWNWYRVQVRNPGLGGVDDASGPISAEDWQQLVLQE